MAQLSTLRRGEKPLFGPAEPPKPVPAETADLTSALTARLKERYQSYERAAARLEIRGEWEAAKLLRKEAGKARLLRNGEIKDPSAA